MARWIYQRPIECCDPTELLVAKRLTLLSDGWVIRWGFYYDSDREGDFLILGPTGGVLVLEVGQRWFLPAGRNSDFVSARHEGEDVFSRLLPNRPMAAC